MRQGIFFHSYAYGTNLYMAVPPDDTGPIDSLFEYVLDINVWMSHNVLQLLLVKFKFKIPLD